MECGKCQRNVIDCICEDMDDKLIEFKKSPYLDPNMIETLQVARAANKYIREKETKEKK